MVLEADLWWRSGSDSVGGGRVFGLVATRDEARASLGVVVIK